MKKLTKWQKEMYEAMKNKDNILLIHRRAWINYLNNIIKWKK